MPANGEKAKKKRGFAARLFFRLAAVFGVLTIYVLSVGPVYKIAFTTRHFGLGVVYFYTPVWWVCEKSRFAEHLLSWYLDTIWGLRDVLGT